MKFIEDLNLGTIDFDNLEESEVFERLTNRKIREVFLERTKDTSFRDLSHTKLNGIEIPSRGLITIRATPAGDKIEEGLLTPEKSIARFDRYGFTKEWHIKNEHQIFIAEQTVKILIEKWISLFKRGRQILSDHSFDYGNDFFFALRQYPSLLICEDVIAIWGRFGGGTFECEDYPEEDTP